MFEKSSEDNNVLYINVFNWRFVLDRGHFDGVYKYKDDNWMIKLSDKSYNMVRFGEKVAYICH